MKPFAILIPIFLILSAALQESSKNESLQENLQGGWLRIYDRDYGRAYSVMKTEDGYLIACSNGILKVDWLGHIIWEKKGYEGDDVIEVEDGYVLAGFDFGPKGDLDATLTKVSKDGKILWQKFYDSGEDYDHAESVVQTRDGGYILVGKAGGNRFWVIKTDEKGREIWNKTYGEGCGKEIIRGIDDGYVIAGFTSSYGAGGYDAFFLKIDENGSIIWKRTWGGIDMDEARCIVATEDGYVATGYTDDFNFFILKLDKDGNVVWSNKKVKSCDIGEGITVCPDGYAAVGFNGDACLVRFDENGNEIWHRYFGGNDPNDGALSVLYDEGYFIIAGYYATNIIANHPGPFLIKCPDEEPENVSIEITRPKPKYLYVFDREIMPYKKTLIIGDIRVVAELHGKGKRVEFYLCDGPDNLDGYLPVKVIYSPPYEWNWNTGDMRLKNFWTPTPYYIVVRTYFGNEESATSDALFYIYKWM